MIPNFTAYDVSDQGRVRRFGRILRATKDKKGYLYVSPCINGKQQHKAIHQLVALAFLPPKPSPRHEINHRDNNPPNNSPTNLEWVTHAENQRHMSLNGRAKGRPGVGNPKLTPEQVLEIRERTDISMREFARRFGVNHNTVYHIRHRHTWRNL